MVQQYFKQNVANDVYTASAPGSMMLFGEHAVLRGKQAIVAAVNKRIHVTLVPSTNNLISISDAHLGTITQSLDKLSVQEPFTYVLQAIMLLQQQIPTGFNLNIAAEFGSIGLGSSAAVTVATIAVLNQWLNLHLTAEQIFNLSKTAVLQIQGFGSGADISASIYGGVLAFNLVEDMPIIRQLPTVPMLTVIYCGYKTATAKVIALVNSAELQQPEKYSQIFQDLHECSSAAVSAIQQQNWPALKLLCQQHHKLQQHLGVSDTVLDALVQDLSAQQQIYGAKISGSGLGDCVIGFGQLSQPVFIANNAATQFTANIATQGLTNANN